MHIILLFIFQYTNFRKVRFCNIYTVIIRFSNWNDKKSCVNGCHLLIIRKHKTMYKLLHLIVLV
jgi:hypothetical protein